MKQLFSLLLILFLKLSSLSAQEIKVVDKVSMAALPAVYIFGSSSYVVTNEYGMANISDFGKNDTITIQHRDYSTFRGTYKQLENMDFFIQLTPTVLHIEEVVVSAHRMEQNAKEVPNKIISIKRQDVEFYNPQTAADLLKISDEVFVQKSQLGGGSPMIRGYSANRVLIVVDGVRMNNAIFRSGNLQNVISLDPNAIERTEVIFGPGSVVYGSDAIGGVMNFTTLKANISGSEKDNHSFKAFTRYSSANHEKTGHISFNLGGKKVAFHTSFSYSDFDDLRMGSKKHDEYQRPDYVDRPYRADVIVENENPNIQKFSGYSQANFMQKVRYLPGENTDISYAFHFSKTSDLPRYDRLTEYDSNGLRFAEWYYGPQVWQMQALNIKHNRPNSFFDALHTTIAYQNFKESRHDRRFGREQIRERFENVHAFSANLDFNKTLRLKHKLFYGLEYVQNKVLSTGQVRSIVSGNTEVYAPRYPDRSDYKTAAAYLSFSVVADRTLSFSGGIRYNYIDIYAPFDKTFYDFPFNEISNQTDAVTGSIGTSWQPADNTRIIFNLATGFRAPNIDDIGKVFDSEPGNVVVPNPELSSEYAYNADLGLTQHIAERIELRATAFYSLLKNALVRRDFVFNGQDSIMYDGELSRVQSLVNADEARVYGIHLGISSDINNSFALKGTVNYAKGEDSDAEPLRHVAPMFASTHLLYSQKQFKAGLYFLYNAEISHENLTASEREKPYMYAADDNGNPYSPSWYTLNFNCTWQINEALRLNAGIENILDHRYRPYSSGIVAPGRNFIIALSLNLR